MKCCCINKDSQLFFLIHPLLKKRLQVKLGEFSGAEKNISGMLAELFLLPNKLIYFEDLFTV